ncbi:hypothetical protein BS78_09G239600 [Paspalum vaginatum]|nr:hypothetical protein BS78_09G239600 [Paspalum vaginatum]
MHMHGRLLPVSRGLAAALLTAMAPSLDRPPALQAALPAAEQNRSGAERRQQSRHARGHTRHHHRIHHSHADAARPYKTTGATCRSLQTEQLVIEIAAVLLLLAAACHCALHCTRDLLDHIGRPFPRTDRQPLDRLVSPHTARALPSNSYPDIYPRRPPPQAVAVATASPRPHRMLQELEPCACGRLHAGGRCAGAAASAFSLLFPVGADQQCHYGCKEEEEEDGSPYGYGGGPVDCTLSLGTPSTRRAEAGVHARAPGAPCKEPRRGSPGPRRCANCDTTSTPLWRNGPRGPKSLCNACGIRYKKEERRAAAAVAPAQQDGGVRTYACGGYARQPAAPAPRQWGCGYDPAARTKSASFGMYGGGDVVVDAASDGPCLSWMLNVMPSSPAFAVQERPTLFQYY